jgi:hypothetical protein
MSDHLPIADVRVRAVNRRKWASTGLLHCNMIGDTLTLMPGER